MNAVRRIQFCAGHRVFNHESKCKNLHGHNYVAYFHAKPKNGLDQLGRVIDFSELKDVLKGWIDDNWDHGLILWENDHNTTNTIKKIETKLFLLPENPTAENMAKYLVDIVCPALFKDSAITINKVVLWETENCYVEVELDETI
jgi:6-pyruvoyltetrahydropterin/6-carboxytetrahydropterin synthase